MADENLDWAILEGLAGTHPDLDLAVAQHVGLRSSPDDLVLALAAAEGRIVLSHDRNTMVGVFYQRVRRGEPAPGLFIVRKDAPVGDVLADMLCILEGSTAEDWDRRVVYLPWTQP